MPLLRAPENRRTGIEINPNVRYPDQTEAAISFTSSRDEACLVPDRRHSRPQRLKPSLFRALTARLKSRPSRNLEPSFFGRARRGKPRLYTSISAALQNQHSAENTECSLNEAALFPPDYSANPKGKHYMARSAGAEHRI